MERISWIHPEIADRIKRALMSGRSSWEEVFSGDSLEPGEAPAGVPADRWPALAEHIARCERVREVVLTIGLPTAWSRFAGSPHAVERGAHIEAEERAASGSRDMLAELKGLFACPIDEQLVYGHFLSRLAELGFAGDPAGTIVAFETFVSAARAFPAREPVWKERLRLAEDGLAGLYVRSGRLDDAEAVFAGRFSEEADDVTVAISAARAFLEHGETGRAITWLERGGERAGRVGRADLAVRLGEKAKALRARMS